MKSNLFLKKNTTWSYFWKNFSLPYPNLLSLMSFTAGDFRRILWSKPKFRLKLRLYFPIPLEGLFIQARWKTDKKIEAITCFNTSWKKEIKTPGCIVFMLPIFRKFGSIGRIISGIFQEEFFTLRFPHSPIWEQRFQPISDSKQEFHLTNSPQWKS